MSGHDRKQSESISVVVAAKNAERTISLCVKSALIGLRNSDEVLVFLDGCTDATGEIVRRINDSRLSVYESVTGVGQPGCHRPRGDRHNGKVTKLKCSNE